MFLRDGKITSYLQIGSDEYNIKIRKELLEHHDDIDYYFENIDKINIENIDYKNFQDMLNILKFNNPIPIPDFSEKSKMVYIEPEPEIIDLKPTLIEPVLELKLEDNMVENKEIYKTEHLISNQLMTMENIINITMNEPEPEIENVNIKPNIKPTKKRFSFKHKLKY